MSKKRGEALTELPAVLNAEMRLTAVQSMRLTGRGRTKFYADVAAGVLPAPERHGPRFVRWRAGDLLVALNSASAR
jgi:predicted DNA-binding transcriptional regulator AlpA